MEHEVVLDSNNTFSIVIFIINIFIIFFLKETENVDFHFSLVEIGGPVFDNFYCIVLIL